AVRSLGHTVRAALETQGDTLARVEAVLNLIAIRDDALTEHRDALRKANLGVLGQPLVSGNAERYDTDIIFPTVQQAFLLPHYRVARAGSQARPADESWWEDHPVDGDLELMLAAYLTSGDATGLPMLLLGHPGAGKSMLTKVLAAAHLPASD